MKSVKPAKAWGVSLMVVGICALIISITTIAGIEVPDTIKRIIGIIDLIAVPVLAYTSVKMFMNMEKK